MNNQGFQVIGTDLRGHGKSDKPFESEVYGTKIISQDIIALMDHLKIEEAHIVGYSIGTVIALDLIQNHPNRFEKAVLLATGDGLIGIAPYVFDRIMPPFAQLLALETFPPNLPRHVAVYQIFLQQTGGNRKALHGFSKASYPAISKEEASKIKVPTLVISGEKDVVLGKGPNLASALGNGQYVEVEKADHFSLAADTHTRQKTLTFFSPRFSRRVI